MRAPSSPCVNVCVMEPAAGLCIGCGRTLEEIARWAQMTEGQRLTVMAALERRLETAFAVGHGAGPDGPSPRR